MGDAHVSRTVPALHRGLDVLELFLDGEQWSVPDITDRLALPRTTAHELVATLVERSYLVPTPGQPVRYRLGNPLIQLAVAFGHQLDLVRESQVIVADLAAACEEAVNVAVLDGVDVIYVVKVDSVHPIRMVSAVGRRLPAHCTSLGKAMLAGLADDRLNQMYPPGTRLPAMTPHSITSVGRLRTELARVRREAVAYDEHESDEGMWCVGAAVRDRSGAVVAGMSISTPEMRRNPHNDTEWARLVRSGADALSARLGFEAAPPSHVARSSA